MTTQINFKSWDECIKEMLGNKYYDMSPENKCNLVCSILDSLIYKGIKIKVDGYSYPFNLI